MPPFIYRCPNPGYRVQGYVAEDVSDPEADEPITGLMCQQVHLVKPATGAVLGEDEK